jgi:hypothetical protein
VWRGCVVGVCVVGVWWGCVVGERVCGGCGGWGVYK